jgi:hypothetical protein
MSPVQRLTSYQVLWLPRKDGPAGQSSCQRNSEGFELSTVTRRFYEVGRFLVSARRRFSGISRPVLARDVHNITIRKGLTFGDDSTVAIGQFGLANAQFAMVWPFATTRGSDMTVKALGRAGNTVVVRIRFRGRLCNSSQHSLVLGGGLARLLFSFGFAASSKRLTVFDFCCRGRPVRPLLMF